MSDINEHDSVPIQEMHTGNLPVMESGASPTKRSRLPLLIAVVVAVAVLAGAGLWWRSFTRSPGYSLGQLAKAVQEKDWDGVQKYVDIDEVVDQLMGVAMSQALEEDDSGFGALGAALFESMKPALAKEVKDSFQEAIENGVSDGDSAPSSLAGFLAADKVKSITYIGDEALVTVEIPGDGDKSVDLRLRMKRVDDFWRVVAIENIEDLPMDEAK